MTGTPGRARLELRTERGLKAAVAVVVVAAAGGDLPRTLPGTTALAADHRDRCQQRYQLGASLRLPPVSVAASGMPVASQTR